MQKEGQIIVTNYDDDEEGQVKNSKIMKLRAAYLLIYGGIQF
jgi:hypothetical protein